MKPLKDKILEAAREKGQKLLNFIADVEVEAVSLSDLTQILNEVMAEREDSIDSYKRGFNDGLATAQNIVRAMTDE